MADTYQSIYQSKPDAGVETTLAAVPAATTYRIVNILVCNSSNSLDDFTLRHCVAGAANDDKQLLFSNAEVGAKDTVTFQALICMATTDTLKLTSTNGNISLNAYGIVTT
jgi:hypothetical protein